MKLSWHLEPALVVESVQVDAERILARGAGGELVLCDLHGETLWATDATYPARAAALGARHVLSVHSREGTWALRATLFEGAVAWEVPLDAARVTRVFCDRRARALLMLNRDGAFRVDVHSEDSGERRHTRPLDRRRGMVDSKGRRVWTRDVKGCTEFDLPARTETKTILDGNGPMTSAGDHLWTVVAGDQLVCVGGGRLRWRTEFEPRDLTELARAEDLLEEGEDEDVWEAVLGRPAAGDSLVLVADHSGRLHALSKDHGHPAWVFESAHYPSSERAAMPAFVGDDIVFPASDEHLYRLTREGREIGRVDLGEPFEGACEAVAPTPTQNALALIPGKGVRAFELT